MGLTALAAVVAVVPGLLTWVWGRRLLRVREDPTLPERVLSWRHRSIAAFAGAAAVLVVLMPIQAPWAIPLLVLVRLAGGFPARRALFEEEWDFVSYLAQFARLTLGVGGFWLLLIAAPALVVWARPYSWLAATALALVLVAWGLAYPRVLLWVTGATPFGRPEIEERLAAIADRSTAPMPRVWLVGHPQGRMANAFALPATGRSSVVFTRTLVEAFDADEIAAVFAHEQAHLEHFDARRVRRLAILQTVAVLAGTLGAAAALPHLEGRVGVLLLGWPLLILGAALFRLVRNKAHETDSDRRAVELCGDAGALARALVKLHRLALVPRRVAVELESRSTHPSLANRLRAIEEWAAPTGAPVEGHEAVGEVLPPSATGHLPTVLEGASPGSWVLLEAQQAHWLEGVPEGTPHDAGAFREAALRVRSLAYSELVELRLEPRGPERVLVASDRAGAAWTTPLAPHAAPSAHTALDVVDRHLAPPSAARPERKALGTLFACAGAIAALAAWSAAWLPALVAVVLPHPGPLAAFGAAALVATVLQVVADSPPGPAFDPALAPLARLGLAVFGAAALWLAGTTAWRERAGRTRSAPWVALLLALCALAVLALPVLGLVTGGVLRAHLAARDHPGGALLLIAAVGALAVVPRRWAKIAAAGLAVAAAASLALGTEAFARRFVHDPFLAQGARAGPAETLALELIDEQPLPAASGQIGLSPSGESWTIREFEVQPGDAPPVHRMIVGSVRGGRHAHEVSDLVLLDDELLLALSREGDRPALELRPHDPVEPALWRIDLQPLYAWELLAADPATGRWRVSGTDPATGAFVRASGGRDGSFEVSRWEPGAEGAAWVAGDGPAVIGVSPRFGEGGDGFLESGLEDDAPPLWLLLAGLGAGDLGCRVLSLDSGGARALYESGLFVQCDPAPPGERQPLCRVHDGAQTGLWRVEPTTGERRPVGAVEGLAWAAQPHGAGWLLLVNAGREQHLHRLEADRMVRLDVGGTPPWIRAVAGFEGGVGVVVADTGRRSRLLRFALP